MDAGRARLLIQQAFEAHELRRFDECADLFAEHASLSRRPLMWFNAACCEAQAGNADGAFDHLERSLTAGLRDAAQLQTDTDLAPLRSDPRWDAMVDRAERAAAEEDRLSSPTLAKMHEADQEARSIPYDEIDWSILRAEDIARQRKVLAMYAAGELRTANDLYRAALILQHGESAEAYRLAHRLARKAVRRDPDLGSARWLVAATQDRYLQSIGEPQIFGTQYRRGSDGRWTLEPFDPGRVTDDERATFGVPSLQETQDRVAGMNSEAATQ